MDRTDEPDGIRIEWSGPVLGLRQVSRGEVLSGRPPMPDSRNSDLSLEIGVVRDFMDSC
jgi:hypothetical protein